MNLTHDEFNRLIASLPQDIQDAFFSDENSQSILDIGEKHGFMKDNVRDLGDETSNVMFGITPISDFVKNLADRLGVDNEKAKAIAEDINQRIFLPLRESLIKVHGWFPVLPFSVHDLTHDEFNRLIASLPQDIQDAFFSDENSQSILDIGEKHGFMKDNVGDLGDETSNVMFGITPISDFVKNLADRLGVDNEKAKAIAEDINQRIFLPLRESLIKVHGWFPVLPFSVHDLTHDEFNRLIASLPQDIQDAFFSDENSQSILDIGEKHGFMKDNVGDLGDETSNVMFGITPISDFVKNLADRLGVDNEKAKAIAEDINRRIFLPLRESLIKVHGWFPEEPQEKQAAVSPSLALKPPTPATPVSLISPTISMPSPTSKAPEALKAKSPDKTPPPPEANPSPLATAAHSSPFAFAGKVEQINQEISHAGPASPSEIDVATADQSDIGKPTRQQSTITCGTCNAQVQLRDKFCPMCGASLATKLREVSQSPETQPTSTMLDRKSVRRAYLDKAYKEGAGEFRYVEALAKLVAGKPVKDWHEDFIRLVDSDLPPFHKYLTFVFLGRGFALQNNSVRAEEMILKARAVLASLFGLSGKQYEDYVLAKSEDDSFTLANELSRKLTLEGQFVEGYLLFIMGQMIRPSESTSWWPPTSEATRPLEALKYLPSSLDARLFLASLYLGVGDIERAISLLEELKADPELELGRSQSMVDKYWGRGLSLHQEEGIMLCLEYLKEAYFHKLLGDAYWVNGDFHLAVAERKNFRNLHPPREMGWFFEIVEAFREGAEENIKTFEKGESKSEETKKETGTHHKERLVNPDMQAAPSAENEADAKGFINAYYSIAEWPKVSIAVGVGVFLGLLFFGAGRGFVFLYIPVLFGATVAVSRSSVLISWIDRLDGWLIDTRRHVENANDHINKFVLKPLFVTLLKITECSQGIEDRFLRSGVRITAYLLLITLPIWAASLVHPLLAGLISGVFLVLIVATAFGWFKQISGALQVDSETAADIAVKVDRKINGVEIQEPITNVEIKAEVISGAAFTTCKNCDAAVQLPASFCDMCSAPLIPSPEK